MKRKGADTETETDAKLERMILRGRIASAITCFRQLKNAPLDALCKSGYGTKRIKWLQAPGKDEPDNAVEEDMKEMISGELKIALSGGWNNYHSPELMEIYESHLKALRKKLQEVFRAAANDLIDDCIASLTKELRGPEKEKADES